MCNHPANSGLGGDFRRHRQQGRLIQGELAAAVGLAGKTFGLLERGRSNLASWRAALVHLDLQLVGRNLPAGESLGEQLAGLCHHRRLGQRELAELVGVATPTLVALERGRTRDGSRRWNECWWCSEPVPTSPPTARLGPSIPMREILDPPGGGDPNGVAGALQAVFGRLTSALMRMSHAMRGVSIPIFAVLPGEPS